MKNFRRDFESGYCRGCGDVLAEREGGYECLSCEAFYSSSGEVLETEQFCVGLSEENDLARSVDAELLLAGQGNGGIGIVRTW